MWLSVCPKVQSYFRAMSSFRAASRLLGSCLLQPQLLSTRAPALLTSCRSMSRFDKIKVWKSEDSKEGPEAVEEVKPPLLLQYSSCSRLTRRTRS